MSRIAHSLASVLLLTVVTASAPIASAAVTVKDDGFIDASTPGVLGIEGGECFDDPAYIASANSVQVLYRPCEEGADNQAYAFLRVTFDGAFDIEALRERGREGCQMYFDRLLPGNPRRLAWYPILPTPETWADGDRTILCAWYLPGRDLEASMLP